MLPSILARQVRNSVEDHLRASFAPSTRAFETLVDDFLAKPEALLKGPWLSLDMPFRRSERDREFFEYVPLGFRPYRHQERAFERLSGDRPASTLVATGTGSGKTECFLLPILEACRRAKAEPGIKAIIIYPMNALATDQARRMAAMIDGNPELKAVRVGIYADQQPANPSSVMTATGVIESRQALVKDPPDILLTNYKMLDYMLVRPDEREIWSRNRPETLRYLIVDELHTFDGAQGSDLASLIRRLKARLGMKRGALACVGTSATLGGPEAMQDLVRYAGEIFDEPFDEAAVVLEDRQSVTEYLAEAAIETVDVPPEGMITALINAADDYAPEAIIRTSFSLWFGGHAPADIMDPDWRVELGRLLDRHAFFQNLLRIIRGQPTPYAEVLERLRENRLYRELSSEHVVALLDSLTALVAHARRTYSDVVDADGRPILLPFFNLRHQLWLRELRRMVASVDPQPVLQHHDDLGIEEQRRSLPVIHCRSCGGAGWTTMAPNDERRPIHAGVRDIYEGYFGFSERLRFVFREPPVPRIKRRIVGQTRQAWLCTRCLVPHFGETPPEEGCTSCRADAATLIEVFVHKPGRLTSERFRVDHDCPFCGSPNGMGILGAQSVTLVSGMIATLFGSEHNDDPKLLTFSDSVQDAAHRAGVFQARNASNVLRAGLSRFVCEEVAPDLGRIEKQAPERMKEEVGSGANEFVATFLPADMEWRRDYQSLLDADALPEDSALPTYLTERLAWDSFAELTFRSRLGATIERTGLVAPHVDLDRLEAVVTELCDRMSDELGIDRALVDPSDVRRFVTGVADHMRARGAVVNDVTRLYVQREGSWYAVTKASPKGRSLPNYAPRAPKPTFPTNRVLQGFESISVDGVGGWYIPWFQKCFDHQMVLTGDLHRDAYELLFRIMEKHAVVEAIVIGHEKATGASRAWGLQPEAVKAFAAASMVRCTTCGNQHHVPKAYLDLWVGMRCTRIGCDGRMAEGSNDRSKRFRTRILTKGRIKRVIAREHTSLLAPDKRHKVEERFMSKAPKTWYPNLLAATPTLEMGINIGDLSTLVLCSVPPEQANYVQRIGRTGRRDGNSLNVTVATARPHDMWYWMDPQEMIAGRVRTPGVHLKAVSILRRQFAAYTLDRLVAELSSVQSYGRLGAALDGIRAGNKGAFPLVWYEFVEANADRLFEGFCQLFSRLREDTEALQALADFARGSATDGLIHQVANEFTDVANEIHSLNDRVAASQAAAKKLKAQSPPPENLEERLKAFTQEQRALRKVRDQIKTMDILGFLTDRGILPNYMFPEQGVTLKSVIYRSEKTDQDDSGEPTITEYVRPASAALSELAPSAHFYADSRKLKIEQIDLSASPLEHWRVCPDCTHIAAAPTETTEDPCPRCGSAMWADKGSRRPMIRLKQVFAIGSDRRTRIGDDGDERERLFFDREYLPAFERDQIGDAYAVDDGVLPFAFEHLRRCTFREVNFGETGDAPSGQKVAGQNRYGHGFTICGSCGRVQDPDEIRRLRKEGSKKGLHAPRCQNAATEDDSAYVSVVYLYREFSSEAIRFLLPLASVEHEDAVKSLRAGIDLGLRVHFKGKVDHLKSSLVETKEPPLTRRHLYLYDTVPGGTGYLKQLATKPNDLKSVFELALAHMRDCRCNEDPRKDGCPRCVRSHASSFGRGEVSRDTAVRITTDILASWDKLTRVNTVDDVTLNKALESELEAMFLSRFAETVRRADGRFVKTAVNGHPGYFVRLGDGEWRLEPQVWLDERFPRAPRTRADFVLWPAVPGADVRPVAIYLDGWQWHHDRIPTDLASRQEAMRTGLVDVWSLTWDDVAGGNGSDASRTQPLAAVSAAEPALKRLREGEAVIADLKAICGLGTFDQFVHLVREPGRSAWQTHAEALAMAFFAAGMAAGRDKDGVAGTVDALGGMDARVTLERVSRTSNLGMLRKGNGVVAVALETAWKPGGDWPGASMLAVVAGFEHRLMKSPDAKLAWNAALHLLNLVQYSQTFYVGCAEGIPLDPAERPASAARAAQAAWDEVEALVLPELLALVRHLRQRDPSADPPEVLFEVADDEGNVLGTLDLAWPARRVGVVLDEALANEFPGWTVVVYAGLNDIFDDITGVSA